MQVITKTHNNSTVKKLTRPDKEIRNGMNQDSQDKNSLKQINLEKIKRKTEKTQQKPNLATLQAASIGAGEATIEDFKILQQNLESNQFIIKTLENQVETKEKITTLDKLATIL